MSEIDEGVKVALAEFEALRDHVGGCTDGACAVKRPSGMHTNGGCKCSCDRIKAERMMRASQRLVERLQALVGPTSTGPAHADAVPWFHVYGQSHWHDDAHLVGNRKALEALRGSITLALSAADGGADVQVFTSDGEGYTLNVTCIGASAMGMMALPYTDETARESRKDAVWPGPHLRTLDEASRA